MRICQYNLLAACLPVAIVALAGAEDATQTRRSELLKEMRSLAEQTEVAFADGSASPRLHANPVFRYDDQPRRFIDATIWAWTNQGYPVAFQKIEASFDAVTGAPKWGYCFASLAEDRLSVQWEHGKSFRSTEAGVQFRPVPDAEEVARTSPARRRQVRDLARQFSARILLNPRTDATEEMRLLSTPIYEYEDAETGRFRGAVFGYSTSGRNPDLLVLFESRAPDKRKDVTWHYAPARMTIGGVTLKHDGKPVWEVPYIEPRPQDFPTWTFFYRPRTPATGEEQP